MSQHAISLESVMEAMKKLREIHPAWPLRIVEEPHLPPFVTNRRAVFLGAQATYYLAFGPQRKLTLWERIRVWFEDLVDRAELTPEVFPWPRVRRPRPSYGAVVFGRDVVARPEAAALLRNLVITA